MNIKSNLFPILIKPNSHVYRYHVSFTGIRTDGKGKIFTGNPENERNNDKSRQFLERRLCYCILTDVINSHESFQVQPEIVYDNRSTLFTNTRIDSIDHYVYDTMSPEVKRYCGFSTIEVKIVFIHELNLDFRFYEGKRDAIAKRNEICHFFELATDQPNLDSSNAVFDRNEIYFLNKPFEEKCGVKFYCGVKKQARYVDESGRKVLKLVVDPIISPFWTANTLASSMDLYFNQYGLNMNSVKNFLSLYRNVCVSYRYNQKRAFPLKKLSNVPLNQIVIDINNNKMQMVNYFEDKYECILEFLDFPVVIDDVTGCMYPPELLTIIPRKVQKEKLDLIFPGDKVLKLNSMKPMDRYALTGELSELLSFNGEMFSKFGFEIDYAANILPANMTTVPSIQYLRNVDRPNDKANFRPGQFIKTEVPAKWCVIPGFGVNDLIVKEFVKKFLFETEKRGRKWPEPVIARPTLGTKTLVDYENWKRLFMSMCGDEIEFVYFIDNDKTDNHGLIKLFEQQSGIVTQQILIKTVNKLNSFHNVYSKSNCKFGGINYNVNYNASKLSECMKQDKIFILGYDVAHVRGILDKYSFPSVVGAAYNSSYDKQTFVGDYFYQKAQTESVDHDNFAQLVHQALKIRQEARDAPCPELILIYRDGLSHGQFSMAINVELEAIKRGMNEFYPDARYDILLLIATKRHCRRFYDMSENNTKPGTYVTDGAIRDDSNGFYLQSAQAIQGTAKYVDYEILVNTRNFSKEEIIEFTYGTCFLHQITTSATSQPSPVFIAHEYAKRGSNILKTFQRFEAIPENAGLDFERLNHILTYRQSVLKYVRFNA